MGFNNPAGRAHVFRGLRGKPLRPRQLLARSGACIGSPNGAVDLLEPVDAFNISVSGQQAAELKAEKMSTTIAPMEERSVSCSLDNYLVLPDHTMDERIAAARRELGSRAVILGHHYQRDEVIRFADFRGDSYKLAKEAARTSAEYILFCGVHFMAESADVLAHDGQQVILPDLNAGCSMADMAEIGQVESCWEQLVALGLTDDGGRRHYSADLHEFHGGDQSVLRRARRAGVHIVKCASGVQVGVCAQ